MPPGMGLRGIFASFREFCKKRNNSHKSRTAKAGKKTAVMTLLDRDWDVKTVKVPNMRKATLHELAKPLVDKRAHVVTDAHLSYEGFNEHSSGHSTVDHSKEYVRGMVFHTNFAESYHSLLKRGIAGRFIMSSKSTLIAILPNLIVVGTRASKSDGERAVSVISTAIGKRLKYAEVAA